MSAIAADWAQGTTDCGRESIVLRVRNQMMTSDERETALQRMDETIGRFYGTAVNIGCHPFIEFAGVMTAYVKSCRRAHEKGVDFSDCSMHTGMNLPIESVEIDYLAEKLACIFGERIVQPQWTPPQTQGNSHGGAIDA